MSILTRSLTVGLAALVTGALLAPSVLADEVTLRAVTAFRQGTKFSQPFERFVERVNANGAGVVQIEVIGGPEAVPAFEVGSAVGDGIVDIANVTGAFYTGLLPAADAMKLTEMPIQEIRANGGMDVIERLHNEAMNVHFLARTGDGIPFHLYLTRPIDGPDLSGLTIRTTPVYRAMFEALGANLVRTPPGEVYTALERGTIDGYGWPSQGILDLGWDEHTNYRVDPGFYQVDVNILVNLDVWTELGDEQKAVLSEAATWIEAENATNAEINAHEYQLQAEAGIEVITFEGEAADAWLTAAAEEGWKGIEAAAPDAAAELKRAFTRQ